MQRASESGTGYRDGDHGVKYLMRGPSIDWGVIRLRPGDGLGAHYHERVEETFCVKSGSPTVIVDGAEHPAAPGDAFRMEPGDRHDVVNSSDGPADIVFIKCPFDGADKVSC